MSRGFKPSRGRVAIRHIAGDNTSPSGIIYTTQENPHYSKGQVLSIGHPELLPNGTPIPVDFEVGDFIVYNKKEGWGEFSGVRIIVPDQVVAIIDEDTQIG
jgi:co-chaperonin GroES (HSP10)